jgi:hypothetical protein
MPAAPLPPKHIDMPSAWTAEAMNAKASERGQSPICAVVEFRQPLP